MIPVAKPLIGEEEIKEVEKVLKSGFIAQGPKVAEFEEAFASYVGVEHAVAVSSGTTALHLSLLAAGVKPDDEVITTPFSFAATGNCALYVGAKPVFVDINPETFNLDPEQIEGAISKNQSNNTCTSIWSTSTNGLDKSDSPRKRSCGD